MRNLYFVNVDTTILSDEEIIKIKIVDLYELYNFVGDEFFQPESFAISKSCLNLLLFEIQNLNTKSDGEMTKIKFIDLDDFYNFFAYDFFIWNYFL